MPAPEPIPKLQRILQQKANPKTESWWENYLKGVIPFRGVNMADVRAALHAWIDQQAISTSLSPEQQLDFSLDLLRLEHSEDKMAGILFLQEVLLPSGLIDWRGDLPRFASLFANGYIYEWNTCDWFCVKVLGPLVVREGVECARAIAEWRLSDNLWQRRASGVAFVNLAKNGEDNFPGFMAMLLSICDATVQSDERFAQTGTGWVLRELGVADQPAVIDFVESHIGLFSTEGLRYATEKMPTSVKANLRKMHRHKEKRAAS